MQDNEKAGDSLLTLQFYKINSAHKLILWHVCMEKKSANHILKIHIIHIYQIILFCPKMLLGVVQKKKEKSKYQTKR